MPYLDRLTKYIRQYENNYPLPNFNNSIGHIETVGKQVKERLKDAAMGEPNPELVQQTIVKFFDWSSKRTTKKFSWLETALLCRGLLVNTPNNGMLLASKSAFTGFLRRFFNLHQDYVLTAYCWQGLLNAYLNISPSQDLIVNENWQGLRKFLQDSLDTLSGKSRYKPRWLDALIEHRVILEENATQSLAQEALQGQMEKVHRIAKELEIPATSWFWPQLLMSQIAVIISYSDENFKSSVNPMLTQLEERKECLDEGLSKLLDRYAECAISDPHQDLKSMVVKQWKSPSLEKQSGWVRVTSEAKRMVQRWLAQEDITEIFGKLVEDNRRYEFWLQFLDQIEYTFVWLGKDGREYFNNRKDRYAILNHGAKPDNNVILMKINDVFIIESGAKAGGKCWAYRAEKIAPLLKNNSVSYQVFRDKQNNLFIQSWGVSDGLVHMSTNWERNFITELEKLQIRPDKMNLDEIIHRYNLRLVTLPSGTERIHYKYNSGTLHRLLSSFQFYFSREGYYYRN